jgi:uncharacterized protein with NRDE domain
MCIVLFAWQVHDKYPLLVAANRDEFHHRPAEPARWRGDLLCGLDLVAGGTWLGISRAGRFAAVTNYREPIADRVPGNRSRGMLPLGFLEGELAPLEYLGRLQSEQQEYGGFNLLVSDGRELAWMSNRGAGPQRGGARDSCAEQWPAGYGLAESLARPVIVAAGGRSGGGTERLLAMLEDDSAAGR